MEKIYNLQVLLGTTGDPFDSWLATRGIRTLDLRVKEQSSNALSLATFLESHQLISKAYYAGLKSHLQHDLVEAQFSNQYHIQSPHLIMIRQKQSLRCCNKRVYPC
ncbi:PLP-dependent transferase [Leuconostoc suionicum]|nr:PLP-dependent transferase [Leuconostoc suionicum]MDI6650927.1 PLP-dependent transferase [Leuconostoc suionicum]